MELLGCLALLSHQFGFTKDYFFWPQRNEMNPRNEMRDQRGVALIIVLALVVLLSALIVSYLSRASVDRQAAHGSFNETKADQLARSAIDIVLGDLKQEIVTGSTASTINGAIIYTPTQPGFIFPARSGNPPGSPDPVPNLIRRSVHNDSIAAPGVGSRACSTNSTTDPSKNGRSISLRRWNKHYLIPRITGATPSDTTPVPLFTPPDWVIINSTGPSASATAGPDIVGRYAFAIYDEGGLIDVNVAGYPPAPNSSVSQFGPKGLVSFADLTVAGFSTSAVNDLVGWRNYASSQPTGAFASFTFTPVSATTYCNAVLANTTGFLRTSGSVFNGRTDQMFLSRQMLIEYRSSTGFSADALQNLGTFSRELNVATWNNSRVPRFPLGKLNEVLASGDAAKIRADFGLIWNTDHWDYYGPTGSTLASSIGSFVSTSPEFFQLLHYAIPGHTIGEILAIGASIIDQNDTDQVTTIIEYHGAAPPNPRAYGADTIPAPSPAPSPPVPPFVLNRSLRSAGELGYAYRNAATNTTLDFYTSGTQDASLLDLFSYSPATTRAGIINLNSRNSLALAAVLGGAIEAQSSTTISSTRSKTAATALVAATSSNPASSRRDLARLTHTISGSLGTGEERQEVLSRAFSDTCQTRTWNLMIDVIAQSGRYPPSTTNLADFVVEGEKRYWLHIAIDRFTGQVIDQQLEAVYE